MMDFSWLRKVALNITLPVFIIISCKAREGSFLVSNNDEQPPSSDLVNFEFIDDLIKKHSIDSVEKLLDLLPTNYTSSFVLLHTSGSEQFASPLEPRVILVGKRDMYGSSGPRWISNTISKDNHAIMAFSGKENVVELQQWREETKELEFREITFIAGMSAQVSDKNPDRCHTCHSFDRKAPKGTLVQIWDPYFFWPKAFGPDDGMQKIGSDLDKVFRKFIGDAPHHPRYKYLLQNIRSLDYTKSKFDHSPEKLAHAKETFDRADGYSLEPFYGDGLGIISQTAVEVMSEIILREIKASADYAKYEDLFVCISFNQNLDSRNWQNVEGLLGKSAFEWIPKRDVIFKSYQRNVASLSGFRLDEVRQDDDYAQRNYAFDTNVWISRNLLKIPTDHWTMAETPGTYYFLSPTGHIQDRLTRDFTMLPAEKGRERRTRLPRKDWFSCMSALRKAIGK